MEIYKINNLSFKYPGKDEYAIKNINLTINSGEFICICGESGCGKTTLLRLLKPILAPHGEMTGEILYKGENITAVSEIEQSKNIGFVMQNPDAQIVTDKVWHELAFGPENLGMSNVEIRTKVAEMASFFGVEELFYKKTAELSGGQKQLLNLASVMVMQPDVLILDEPTSQLDVVAASNFIKNLKKINDELGTTIILTEHRLEEVMAYADKVVVMDDGRVIAEDFPADIGKAIYNHPMYDAMPVPVRVFSHIEPEKPTPLTIKEGKHRIEEYFKTHKKCDVNFNCDDFIASEEAVKLKDVYFKYDRDLPDVIKGLNLKVFKGEIFTILGGNGTGKSTLTNIIGGILKAVRGRVYINGTSINDVENLYNGVIGVLPQNPQSLFTANNLYDELISLTDKNFSPEEKEKIVETVSKLCKIEKLLKSHPYDLSGGEQQRVALAMILIKNPEIIILDEPTKGMDAHFKKIFLNILKTLKASGKTIIIVSHDVEFSAIVSDRCALMFDGSITSCDVPRIFFSGNYFYTTAANKMARGVLPEVILAEDIIKYAGCKEEKNYETFSNVEIIKPKSTPKTKQKKKISKKKIFFGIIFALLFCVLNIPELQSFADFQGSGYVMQGLTILFAFMSLMCFMPEKDNVVKNTPIKRKTSVKSNIITIISVLVIVPLTILAGIYLFDDKKYYFISVIVIFEIMLPFYISFENKKPSARELVIISILCATAIIGRTAFFMLPQFKPMLAIIIIAGVCFGGETGFLVGCITGFVTNFYFGHGPWTPWQMFAMCMCGFVAGVIFKKGLLSKTKGTLAVFGFIVTMVLYGGILNPASALMMTPTPTWELIISSYAWGITVDLVHALSTAFFLWFIGEPMIERIERIKSKYGISE